MPNGNNDGGRGKEVTCLFTRSDRNDEGEKKRVPLKSRWVTIAIGIACSRNILTRESPPFDACNHYDTSLRYESIVGQNLSFFSVAYADVIRSGRCSRNYQNTKDQAVTIIARQQTPLLRHEAIRKDFLTRVESPWSWWQYEIESRSIA